MNDRTRAYLHPAVVTKTPLPVEPARPQPVRQTTAEEDREAQADMATAIENEMARMARALREETQAAVEHTRALRLLVEELVERRVADDRFSGASSDLYRAIGRHGSG